MVASVLGVQAVHAATGEENDFVSHINRERANRGLRSLSWSEDLAVVARRHSNRMANENHLYHNPNLRDEVSGWEVVGENVGYGPSVEDLHQAFMNSSSHRANILDSDYTQVGVGTTWRDGTLWVTEVFRKPMSQSSSKNSATASAPKKKKTVSSPRKPAPAKPKPAAPAPAAPVAPLPATEPSLPASDLTRLMVENLLGSQDPAAGSIYASELFVGPASIGSSSIVGLTFRPFAELAGRVNRDLIEKSAG